MDAGCKMGIKKSPESGIENERDGSDFRVKVVGSNPAGPTIRVDRAQSQKEKIANFLFYLKKKGYRKSTLEGYSDVLKHLARNVDVDDAETVNFHCK